MSKPKCKAIALTGEPLPVDTDTDGGGNGE